MDLRANFKALPKEIWLLYVTTMISRVGMMVLPFLAVYVSSSFGIDRARAGFTITIYGLGALLTAPITGYLCDRLSPLYVMKLTLFLQGLILLVFPFANGFNSILVITLVLAIVGEAFKPASLAFISSLTDEKQRRVSIALNRSAINVGMSIGPALGGILAGIKPILLFFANSAASIFAGSFLAVSLQSKRTQELVPESSSQNVQPNYDLNILKDRRLLVLLLTLLPVFVVFFQYRAALPQYLIEDHHMKKNVYGFLFTINTLLVIIFEAPLNSALERWSEKLSMALGSLLMGIGFGGFAFATTFPAAAACVIMWTLGEMSLFSSSSSYISKIAGVHKGKSIGLYHMAINFAAFIGPGLGAVVLTRSARALWATSFFCGCLSAALLLLLNLPIPQENRA